MREVCFFIDRHGGIRHADTSGSALALPDSRDRWERLWALKDEVVEVAHSHPRGPHAFSAEDTSTMAAIDAALGRPLRYSIVSPRGRLVSEAGHITEGDAPWWLALLKQVSGME